MEPIIVSSAIYIASKFLDQFLTEAGYGGIKRLIFPEKKYTNRLYIIIQETATEFSSIYPPKENEIPFYQSQALFETLNNYILFTALPNKSELLRKFDDHPNITPPSDSQLETFYNILSKKINDCKELKKLHINENYKQKIFDIYDEILQIKLILLSINEGMTFNLSENWLDSKNKEAIADLGGRYTPKLNMKLDITEIFSGLGRTIEFSEKLYSHIDNFLIKGKKITDRSESSSELISISKHLDEVYRLYFETDLRNPSNIPLAEIINEVNECLELTAKAESKIKNIQEKASDEMIRKNIDYKYTYSSREFGEFENECYSLLSFLNSITAKLSNNPFLLLEGEAGIGKSHLLADLVESRRAAGNHSLLLLGQQLTTEESPWVQILKRLQLKNTSYELLEKLNLFAKSNKNRLLIIIDAINEGNGNKIWEDNINSFVDEFKKFEWLGLVMSVRSTYKGITITEEKTVRNKFENFVHFGFTNVEIEAVNKFYDYYNIETPSSPNLNPEFRNPLFLKLLCEGLKKSGLSKVPVGFNGISKILSFYVEGVNKSLSSQKKYKYDPSFNLVHEVINELIKVKLADGESSISLKKAHAVVQSVVNDYVSEKTYLMALIDEGLLTKSVIHNYQKPNEEVVHISFERFDDHLTVQYLLKNIEKIQIECEPGGLIYHYLENENEFYFNQGIIEALSIQLPEKYGKEVYELFPKIKSNEYLVKAFIKSLVWRDVEAINFEKILPYINNEVIEYYNSSNDFLEMLISITGVEKHPLNGDFLHEWLLEQTLPERDAFWTKILKHKYNENSNFKYLIDWAWSSSNKSHISDESIELLATTLCWFLTSSNRELRDCSTKALVNLLENRITVLIAILNKFGDVNDPYVCERIYAVALGCTLRTKEKDKLYYLADTVYGKVFIAENIYPNILLRDYAREIIEYTSNFARLPTGIDILKTEPPYRSVWPIKIPKKEELKSLYTRHDYPEIWSSVLGSGDFARYIIGTNHSQREWSAYKIDETPIDRKKLLNEFLVELSPRQLALYDSLYPYVPQDDTEEKDIEFLLSWDSLTKRKSEEEINVSKQEFKNSLSQYLLVKYEVEIEPYLDNNNKLKESEYFDLEIAQCFIFNRIIQLGWDPKLHGEFDNQIGTGRGQYDSFNERLGKKYQWIAYHEFMALLSDNFTRFKGYRDSKKINSYSGPWDPFLRDIDPTILLRKTGRKQLSQKEAWWTNKEAFNWNCSYDQWANDVTTIKNPSGLIEIIDNSGGEWLVLEAHPSWKEPKLLGKERWEHPRKEVWCQIRSYLVKKNEFDNFKSWSSNQNFMGRWMPESSDLYQIFDKEYYWSKPIKSFKKEYDGIKYWTELNDPENRQTRFIVSVTSINYTWSHEYDRSKVDNLQFLKPSLLISEKMKLISSNKAGHYEDENGNIICFAAEALYESEACLLIKKEPFLRMLQENDLEIAWTFLGEKGVIGGPMNSDYSFSRIEFSGSFYFEENTITGAINNTLNI